MTDSDWLGLPVTMGRATRIKSGDTDCKAEKL